MPGRVAPAPTTGTKETKIDNSDITSLAQYQLEMLKSRFQRNATSGSAINNAHFKNLISIIDNTLDKK